MMKLLFIGNSHTYYNDLGATVLKLLEAVGTRPHVTISTTGGKSLVYHTTKHDVLFNIRYGGYDVVIAQDQASSFDPASFRVGAEELKRLAEESGARFYLYMPWACRDDRKSQHVMTDAYLSFCRNHGCRFAPVGEVFSRILQHEQADALYREDGNHATPLGSYIAAVTIFYMLTGRKRMISPRSIADPGIAAGFDEELCRRIHAEACRIVRLYNS
ncbi:MAG: hypothetical protein E7663_02530 [Ruminococcaceae bacterium]|nr:hypothetical protein [Oscillospiraceae bacterium]